VERVHSDANTKLHPAAADLFNRGHKLFAERSDKEWSLTDGISFVVTIEQLREAACGFAP